MEDFGFLEGGGTIVSAILSSRHPMFLWWGEDLIQYSGTGIGLALCKKIVENHHGQIFATSSPGEGANFHIILPLTAPTSF